MNRAWLIASFIALAACGPTTDDRPIASLSLAELSDLCSDELAATSEVELRGMARLICVSRDNSEGECEPAALAECTDGVLAEMRAHLGCELTTELQPAAQACQEPAQTMLDCMGGFFAQMPALTNATCDLSTVPPFAEPDACIRLSAACPGFSFDRLEDYFFTR